MSQVSWCQLLLLENWISWQSILDWPQYHIHYLIHWQIIRSISFFHGTNKTYEAVQVSTSSFCIVHILQNRRCDWHFECVTEVYSSLQWLYTVLYSILYYMLHVVKNLNVSAVLRSWIPVTPIFLPFWLVSKCPFMFQKFISLG